ncbi:MAG: ATP-binding protein [Verrucomicrobiota bacterium]
MQNLVQRRLLGLIATIVLMGMGIAFLTVNSQWQARELRAQLRQVDSESFRIADQFVGFLRQLNESLYHYGQSHTPLDVKVFTKASEELDHWIDAQKPKLNTGQEKTIMQQIDTAYDDYLRVATVLLARFEALGDTSATMDEYTALRKESQRLFDLGQSLSRAHFASRNQVLARANHTISELRVLVLVSLGLLFAFALALGIVVYRDMIVPLRLKLVESESLRERQEKLTSLGVLAAGVAHEIRNPLTAIKAALFIQQKKLQPGSQDEADGKIINREILRLERIVNDFLLFARPGDSKLALLTADAPLRGVHALLAPQLAQDNIQIVLAETPPLPITADADQLEQVLINLVRNAAEAIDRNGVIKLRARADRKRLNQIEASVVILEVEDNGKGISPEVQKRLFDPFFTTKDTGTGLGLSIAARIVQGHGGLLEYQTAPGRGTTFGIVLPVAASQAGKRAD